jgi:hypothetical protein
VRSGDRQHRVKNNLITIFNYDDFENHNRAARYCKITINFISKNDSLLLIFYQVGRNKNLYSVSYPKYKDDGNIGYIKTGLLEKFYYLEPSD